VIANAQKPVIIKKYPDRRLYNTATHTFMTLDDLADLVRQGIELAIHETKSGKDITRSLLLHIILERERKETQNCCQLLSCGNLSDSMGTACK
jgi:polyhydroxyalkanoate synthesis repressor PhaR